MTHEESLRIIAEFMGWELYMEDPLGPTFDCGGYEWNYADSFDTMRMVLDEFKDVDINPSNSDDYSTHKKICYDIIQILGWGTPADCALRLAEAIEWWKTVKQ